MLWLPSRQVLSKMWVRSVCRLEKYNSCSEKKYYNSGKANSWFQDIYFRYLLKGSLSWNKKNLVCHDSNFKVRKQEHKEKQEGISPSKYLPNECGVKKQSRLGRIRYHVWHQEVLFHGDPSKKGTQTLKMLLLELTRKKGISIDNLTSF